MILQANPFPECQCEAQAIILMVSTALIIFILVFLLLFMFYLYKKSSSFLQIITVYLFSLVIGVMTIGYLITFIPYFSLFFIFFQSVLFFEICLRIYDKFKIK